MKSVVILRKKEKPNGLFLRNHFSENKRKKRAEITFNTQEEIITAGVTVCAYNLESKDRRMRNSRQLWLYNEFKRSLGNIGLV